MAIYKELWITKSDGWSKEMNKRSKVQGRPSKYKTHEFVKLREQGMTHEAIAQHFGCAQSTVTAMLAEYYESCTNHYA